MYYLGWLLEPVVSFRATENGTSKSIPVNQKKKNHLIPQMSLLMIYPLSITSNSFIIPNSCKSQNKPKLEEVLVE